MNSIKAYNSKLPIEVKDAINLFTNNECILVKKDLNHSYNQPGNCHYNVQSFADENGGDIIFGWQLQRKSHLINAGIWLWVFHSVLKKNDNEYFDITKDLVSRKHYSTFIADSNRYFDNKNGRTYNDIVILEKNTTENYLIQNVILKLSLEKFIGHYITSQELKKLMILMTKMVFVELLPQSIQKILNYFLISIKSNQKIVYLIS